MGSCRFESRHLPSRSRAVHRAMVGSDRVASEVISTLVGIDKTIDDIRQFRCARARRPRRRHCLKCGGVTKASVYVTATARRGGVESLGVRCESDARCGGVRDSRHANLRESAFTSAQAGTCAPTRQDALKPRSIRRRLSSTARSIRIRAHGPAGALWAASHRSARWT